MDDGGRSIGSNLHLLFDTHLAERERVLTRQGMLLDPYGCPANKVGGENSHGFLQIDRGFGTDFQTIEIKNLFGFLDACLNGLTRIVTIEPSR